MSSINLLPKNLIDKNYLINRKRDAFLISFLMMLVSVIAYTTVFVTNASSVKKLGVVDSRLGELDESIKRELNENKLPVEESKIEDGKFLLESHNYYSQALNAVQDVINNDVYLVHGEFSFVDKEVLTFSFNGFAENYMAAIEQVVVLKNSFWINEASVYNFLFDEDEGVEFEGDVIFNKDIISYKENYWNSGLDILSSRENSFLKIENYSANLKEFIDEKYIVEIKFSGSTHNREKLILLEDSLKKANRYVTDASIYYEIDKGQASDSIKFNGKMEFSYKSI
ncbi:MAG: hypothetical protein KAI57_00875 [Candidatus Pacebacteria bacterium]|nr:hypothetical protein [Candidatus Paceibacterota bacterium]